MVTAERQQQMLDAPDFEECTKLLVDCGYPDLSGMTAREIETALAEHKAEILEELTRLCPEKAFCNIFRLKYDYHNAKTLIKAEGVGLDPETIHGILSDAGTVPPQMLADAYYQERYMDLPSMLGRAMEEAKKILARTGNPQLSDFALDRAYFAEMKSITERMESPFLTNYIRTIIDSTNLKIAVRALRMGKSLEFLQSALVPGGSIGVERLAGAAMTGDGLVQLFTNSIFDEAVRLGSSAVRGKSYTNFERACDNAMVQYLKGARLKCFGEESVIAYIAALEYEITAVRIILIGKLSRIDSATIRERLRDCYA
jgi:V/A-type H+-transporting ATPase subunit C